MQKIRLISFPVQVINKCTSFIVQTALKAIKHLCPHFRQNPRIQLQHKIMQEVQKGMMVPQTNFPEKVTLPEKYGRGLPERAVELLLVKMVHKPNAEVLDVGHANAMMCHLELIKSLPSPKKITGIDIAEPVFDVAPYYQKSIRGNIADTNFDSNQFDCIWCISALEHFGMNNSGYTSEFTMDNTLAGRALQEMVRILKPGGQILITVPFGKYEDHEWLINYDTGHLQSLLNIAKPQCSIHELYFRHTYGAGWTVANPVELKYVGYFDQANSGAGALAAVIIDKHL
jgi:ubiquinone/menaquinone biosynthesis C-methylase UbiE